MPNFLTILEVSQKQAYIFSSKQLQENAARSREISDITSSAFFARTAGALYREEDNLVYAGGGHTVLQFETRDQAVAFSREVTGEVLRRHPGLELFVKTIAYDPSRTPGDNLKALSQALERKKARRRASFRQVDLGLEQPETEAESGRPGSEPLSPPEGYRFPHRFEELVRALPAEKADGAESADNFIAVVHIDGNAMGTRVDSIYSENTGDWDRCRASLRRFSEGIQADFEGAFQETVGEVIRALQPEEDLPIRPIILAGDDVCFVTAGNIGLECARVFLEKLSLRTNAQQPEQPYAACAGVSIVHLKYPFHRAYDLAEELCSSAKRYGASLDGAGRVSAIDWHIEFGQLKEGLSELREDYRTEDGCRLELRPVTAIVPTEAGAPAPERTYDYFRKLCGAMRAEQKKIARGKIKELRTALKQGTVEADFYLQNREIGDLIYQPLEAAYPQQAWIAQIKNKGAFRAFPERDGTVKRCLVFDAIELMDHFMPFEEVNQ